MEECIEGVLERVGVGVKEKRQDVDAVRSFQF